MAISAMVLYVVERVFLAALPGLVAVLLLVAIYRVAIGRIRRDGW